MSLIDILRMHNKTSEEGYFKTEYKRQKYEQCYKKLIALTTALDENPRDLDLKLERNGLVEFLIKCHDERNKPTLLYNIMAYKYAKLGVLKLTFEDIRIVSEDFYAMSAEKPLPADVLEEEFKAFSEKGVIETDQYLEDFWSVYEKIKEKIPKDTPTGSLSSDIALLNSIANYDLNDILDAKGKKKQGGGDEGRAQMMDMRQLERSMYWMMARHK